jgi:hypothetical protein
MLALSAFTSFPLDAAISGRRTPEFRRATSRSDIGVQAKQGLNILAREGTHYAIYHR